MAQMSVSLKGSLMVTCSVNLKAGVEERKCFVRKDRTIMYRKQVCKLKPTCFEGAFVGKLIGLEDGPAVCDFEGLVEGDQLGDVEGLS